MNKFDFIQGSDEWKKSMSLNIGGSEVYSVLGNDLVFGDQSETDIELIANRKLKKYIANNSSMRFPPMIFGKVFEPIAAKFLEMKLKVKLDNANDCFSSDGVYRYSPDGIIDSNTLVEIKFLWSRNIIDDFIPKQYRAQCLLGLHVLKLSECFYSEFEIFVPGLNCEEPPLDYVAAGNVRIPCVDFDMPIREPIFMLLLKDEKYFDFEFDIISKYGRFNNKKENGYDIKYYIKRCLIQVVEEDDPCRFSRIVPIVKKVLDRSKILISNYIDESSTSL